MDYVEQIDKLIEQFAGEASGLLVRVGEVGSEMEYIEDHISALKRTLTAYEKNVAESEKKIHAAGAIFEELKVAIAKLAAEIASIKNAQYSKSEHQRILSSMEGVQKNTVRVLHAVTDLIGKLDNTSTTIKETGKTVTDKYLIANTKLEDIKSAQSQTNQELKSVQKSVLDNTTRTEQSIEEIGRIHASISNQLAILRAAHDGSIKHMRDMSEKLDNLKNVHEQLSLRLDNIAMEVEISKSKAEEQHQQTQDTLNKLLTKMEDIEGILASKKKGLFR